MARRIVLVQSVRKFLAGFDQCFLHLDFLKLEVVEAACRRLQKVRDLRGDAGWVRFCGTQIH